MPSRHREPGRVSSVMESVVDMDLLFHFVLC